MPPNNTPPNDPQNHWQSGDEPRPELVVNQAPVDENFYQAGPVDFQPVENFNNDPEADYANDDSSFPSPEEPVTWVAQEYVHPERGTGWFIAFGLAVIGLIALDIFVLKAYTFSVLVVVMAIALIIYIRRPPRDLTYSISPSQGLYVSDILYPFEDFKSFGLIRDEDRYSVMLIPRKRFAPGVSVFFPEEVGERIVDILGKRLPMEEMQLDIVDIIVRKLRL